MIIKIKYAINLIFLSEIQNHQKTIIEKNGYVYVRKLNADGKTAWKLKIKPPDL